VTSVVPAGDPTATIDSPSSGRTYVVGQKVGTTFACADPNGPGIATCSDGASTNGNGVLTTSSTGEFSYVVTATSKNGQITTTRIRYKVVPRTVSLTIYFPNNSSVLTPAATSKLNGFANVIADDGFRILKVSGYASSTGAFANNHNLGVQRARVAWRYLQTRLASLSVTNVSASLRALGATRFRVAPSTAAGNRRTVLSATM
jgi:outer membrane protein OmpA-like peptidoglycan-associated protein